MNLSCPSVKILLCIGIAQSLSAMDNPNDTAVVNKEAREITQALLTERHPLFDHVRAIMDDLARAVANVWRTILGQPLDLGNDPGPRAHSIDQQLFEVQRHIERLDHAVTEQVEDPLWQSTTETQRVMVYQLKKNTTAAKAVNNLAGGGAAAVGVWFLTLNPLATLRKLKELRFTGLEIPAAIGIIKPLLTPVVVLIVGAIVYSKVKNFFLYEYKEQTQERIRDLEAVVKRYHEAEQKGLEAHKKEMAAALLKHEGRMNDAISQARHNIINLQQEADANNKRLDELIGEEQKKLSAQIAQVQKDFNQQLKVVRDEQGKLASVDTKHNEALRAQKELLIKQEQEIDEINKKLEEEDTKIKRYFTDLQELRKGTRDSLDELKKNLDATKALSLRLGDKVERQMIPAIATITGKMASFSERCRQELHHVSYMQKEVMPVVKYVNTVVEPYLKKKKGLPALPAPQQAQTVPPQPSPRSPASPTSPASSTPPAKK